MDIRAATIVCGGWSCYLPCGLAGNVAQVQKGQTMLVVVSFLCLAFCLFAGGSLTADCVSSERRNGTLGLLFLTPLTGTDIVVGKMFCHGLRLLYAVGAVFPIFFLPLLTGGVTGAEVCRILVALLLALFLSACVGMIVSTLTKESGRAMMGSFSTILLITAIPMLIEMIPVALRSLLKYLPQFSPVFTVLAAFDFSYRTLNGPRLYWRSALAVLALGVILFILSVIFVSRGFQIDSKAAPPTRHFRHRLFTAGHRTAGAENPFAWLMLRNMRQVQSLGVLTYSALPLFAIMLVVALTTGYWGEAFSAAFFTALVVHIMTKLRFVVGATWQITNDQLSGALELLLVTTLSDKNFLKGYHDAQWRIFRKSLVTLISLNLVLELCVLLFSRQLHMDGGAGVAFSTIFIGGMMIAVADFSALRWLALLRSLQASTHVKAVLRTFSSVMLIPWLGVGIVILFLANTRGSPEVATLAFSGWIIFNLVCDWVIVERCRAELSAGLRGFLSKNT